MVGISGIQNRIDRRTSSETSAELRKELWFKDGDQAFMSIVATGDEDDPKLADYWMYTFNEEGRWNSVLGGTSGPLAPVPEGTRPSHRFGFWAFVHDVLHTERRVDTWEPVEGPSGRKLYRENVDDFKIVPLAFGRSNYIWNQLVDVYNDWGALNKGVVRVRRTGSGMQDTSYTVVVSPRELDIPSDKIAEIDDLVPVIDYMNERYGVSTKEAVSNEVTVPDTAVSVDAASDDDDLPF